MTSPIDQLISRFDLSLRALTGNSPAGDRASPAQEQPEAELNAVDRRESGRLMRVNHCGEVCAQALYL
ncbi:MAG: 2-polyprenyl-3-methyl-6-methoxy-1,4-benzoquinone monooxygenase, partial [Pseudomonadales bacterium]